MDLEAAANQRKSKNIPFCKYLYQAEILTQHDCIHDDDDYEGPMKVPRPTQQNAEHDQI